MRLSAVLSAALHIAIIAATMTAFANRTEFNMEVPENIPVELLTLSDVTNVSAAVEESEEPVEEEVPEVQAPEPEPQPRQTASLPDPVLELPEPEAEYLPEDDAEPEPEPEPVEAEPDPEPQTSPPPSVRPNVRPRPPERRQGFDFDAAAALLDRAPREEEPDLDLENLEIGETTTVETAERSRSALGAGTALTVSQMDALNSRMRGCWNLPAGVPNPEDKTVVMRVGLNRDGSLRGRPQVVDVIRYNSDRYFRTVADSASRAVIICQGQGAFSDLPQDRYSDWQTLELVFDLAGALELR